jgi:SAM-dependent methyltransferase
MKIGQKGRSGLYPPGFPPSQEMLDTQREAFAKRYAEIVARICAICRVPKTAQFGAVAIPQPSEIMPPFMQRGANILAFFKEVVHETGKFSQEAEKAHSRRLALLEFQALDEAIKDPRRFPQLLDAAEDLQLHVFLDANRYFGRMPHPEAYEKLFTLLSQSERGLRVLDIGAGLSGLSFLGDRDISPQHYILLLDNNPVVFQYLVDIRRKLGRKASESIRIAKADFLKYADPNHPFDILFAFLTLRQIPKEQRPLFFAKSRELLASSGKLIIGDSTHSLNDKSLEEDIMSGADQNRLRIVKRSVDSGFSIMQTFTYELEAA